ncbi:MAG: putative PAS/PAC sensor protein [Chloroflexi bacterium]|nr:MAG: putative PAS/PAC sensor protein [Chloroflexota bacterium]
MKRETADQKTIRKLVESEIKRMRLADDLDQAYWVRDLHTGQILYISKDYERIWGRTHATFYAQPNSFLMSVHPEDRQAVLTTNSRIDEISNLLEYRIYKPDGEMRWVTMFTFLLPETSGEPYRQVYFSQDITARKDAFIELVESKVFLQSTLDALSSHIAILDENGVIVAVNSAWRKFGLENGLALKEFGVGANYLKICDLAVGERSEEASVVSEAIWKIISNENAEVSIEYPCHSPAEKRWFVVHITAFNIIQRYIVIAHENITARKLAEERLQENEWKFRSLTEQSSEGIVLVGVDGIIIEWNESEERITGVERERAIGRYIWEVQAKVNPKLAVPEFMERKKGMLRNLLETGETTWIGQPLETEIIKPDGKPVMIQSLVFPIKKDYGFMACIIHRDVTELNKAIEAKILSESKYHSYLENSPISVFIVDQTGKFLEVNQATCNQLGYSRDELLHMLITQVVPSQEINISQKLLMDLIEKGSASAELRFQRKDQTNLTVFSNAVKLSDGTLLAFCTDITGLKLTESKLQESEAFLKSILDNIPEMITVKETETLQFLKVNRPVEEYLGIPNDQIIGKSVHDLFPKNEADFYTAQDKKVIIKKEILDIAEENVITRDSGQRILHEKKIPMFRSDGSPQFILSIAEDVTKKTNLEVESKQRLTMLEAVGKLSKSLRTARTLEDMLPILIDAILEIMQAEIGSIWLYRLEKNDLEPAITRGYENKTGIPTNLPLKPGEGIPGMVFNKDQPHIAREYRLDAVVSETGHNLIESGLGGVTVPLRTAENVIGVINVSVELPREITQDEVQLLSTLSEIAGNAIQRTTLKEQTEHRLRQLSALSSIDRAISSSFDMQVSLEILVSNVISQLNMDAANVLLFNPENQMLEYTTGQGFRSNAIERTFLRLGESYAGRAALERKLIQVLNLKEPGNRLLTTILANENFITYFGVPLIAKGQLKGVLEVFRRSPFEPDEDWLNFLRSLAEQASIAIDNTQMFENLYRSNTELSLAYNATIEGWSRALDLRDKETEGHTQRVTELTLRLARKFEFSDNDLKQIRWGALLHDIGKLGVPDGILHKPEPLSDNEWEVMRLHPRLAYEMLSPIGYLRGALDIPYCHHEKWDGTGYPRGLSAEQIPLSARIFAVVDVWDALRSDRPYRKAWSEEKVIKHIRSLAGSDFDPKIVKECLESGAFTNDAGSY